jgi:hypothetical protein
MGVVVTTAVWATMWTSSSPWTLVLDTGNVFLGQTVPAFRAWFAGQVPEWSDLLWGGYPLIGDSTSGALYAPHAIAFLATRDWPLRFFDVALALHLGLFAAGTAALVRQLGAGYLATALAAIVATLCPYADYAGLAYFPVFGAHAWWPWAVLAAELLTRPGTPLVGGAMILGWVALAAQVLVGVPEQATFGGCIAAAWLLFARSELGVVRRVVRLLLLAAGSIALCAPQLFATVGILPWTERASTPVFADLGSLWLTDPTRLLLPGFGAMNGNPSFIGVATPALALVAVALRRRRATLLLVIAATGFVYSLGPQTAFYDLVHELPPFTYFRNPAKAFAIAEFTVAWAAVLGADELWRRSSTAARLLGAILVVAMLAERALYVAWEVPAVTWDVAESLVAPTILRTLAALPFQRELTPPVVYDTGGMLGGGSLHSIGALAGISSLRAGSVAYPGRAPSFMLNGKWPRPHTLNLLGARYLIVPSASCEYAATRYRWRPLADQDGLCVLERQRGSNPRHVLLTQAVHVESIDEMLAIARARPQDPIPVVGPIPPALTLRNFMMVSGYSSGHATVTTSAASALLLLVRDAFAPGWHATVDGTEVPLYPAAGMYFAVPISPGVHLVSVDYRAPGLREGFRTCLAWLAGTALVLVGRGLWALRLRRRAALR